MTRIAYTAAMESGDSQDNSATPICLQNVQAMSMTYAKEGSADSMVRKMAIGSAWWATGRSSEIGKVALDSVIWDPYFNCSKLPQDKTSKFKLVAFVAGVDHYTCFYSVCRVT